MITYVNTVFVSNNASTELLEAIPSSNFATYKGRFIMYDIDNNLYSVDENTKRFKIGMLNGKTIKDHKGQDRPMIKWSNIINVDDIKSLSTLDYAADTEDSVIVDFTGLSDSLIGTNGLFKQAGKRIIVRLTFKDMIGFRYRKWTESYEYITQEGDTVDTISANITNLINKLWKRARVHAVDNGGEIILTALPYDDDNAVDTLNWAEKVRFNVNVYYTDPAAEGWESLNKHFPTGLTITKTPGKRYAASAKLVRDRESQAMGYDGILNRGNGTWPIIKPEMETNLDGHYNAVTLEFENMYRAADDIFRKTKQAVEIYATSGIHTVIADAISAAVKGASFADASQQTKLTTITTSIGNLATKEEVNTLRNRVIALETPANNG